VHPTHTRRHALLLTAATLVLLLPFLGRAYNIDEPLFLWLGEHLQRDPWNFYGFDVNWYGTPQPMHEVTQNPPLAGYWIALWAALLGWSEVALHAAFLPSALASVLGTYFLARRFCAHPHAAALLALATPAFLLSATTVMCDVTMLAFYVWALVCWVEGVGQKRTRLFVLAGVLALCASLTKYYGATVVPLGLAWALTARERPRGWWLALLIPLAGLLAYEWRAHDLYGHGLLRGAASYATDPDGVRESGALERGAIGLMFAGACFAPALFLAPLVWSRTRLLVGVAALAAIGFGLGAARSAGQGFGPIDLSHPPIPLTLGLRLQLLAAAMAGASLLGVAALDLVRRRDRAGALLVLWLAGTFAFASWLNWTNNGRSNLPLVPPAAILFVRALEARGWSAARPARAHAAAFAPCLALALFVAWADARWAGTIHEEARGILARHAGSGTPLWFQGHWGFQYYMQRGGALPLDLDDATVAPGERIAMARNNVDQVELPLQQVRVLERTSRPEPGFVRTHSWELRAGFYSSVFGPLPYAFGAARPDAYVVCEVLKPLRLSGLAGPSARRRPPGRRGRAGRHGCAGWHGRAGWRGRAPAHLGRAARRR
jgi:hypothetical protein